VIEGMAEVVAKGKRRVVAERQKKAIPLLGKGGVAAPLIKCREASLDGADGVVRSTPDNRRLNQPPRPLLQRRLRGIFITVASTPP
jgi:hypothetical protein